MSEVARNFLKTLLEVFLEGDAQGVLFTGPRLVLHLTHQLLDGSENRRMLDLICRVATRTRRRQAGLRQSPENPESAWLLRIFSQIRSHLATNYSEPAKAGSGAANFSSVALNLPRIGFLAGETRAVFDLLTDLLELAAQAKPKTCFSPGCWRWRIRSLSMLARRLDGEPFLPLAGLLRNLCPLGLAELVNPSAAGRPC
ncbi:MAG: hypothetical protein IPG76_20215 [Acidobacteria bacterium]|nr:hypothetical protein [Acidobacteriota bacterium]